MTHQKELMSHVTGQKHRVAKCMVCGIRSMGILQDLHVLGESATVLVMLDLPFSAARRMLPPQLSLGQQDLSTPGTHPLVISFNHHRNVRMSFRGVEGPAYSYQEIIVGLPYVHLTHKAEEQAGPFFYAPILFLDATLPTLAGTFWGFAKERRWIEKHQDGQHQTYEVRMSRNDPKILSLQSQDHGEAAFLGEDIWVDGLLHMLQMPGICKPFWGSLLRFHSRQWLAHPRVQPQHAKLDIATPFVPGLPEGHHPFVDQPDEPWRALRLDLGWELDGPRAAVRGGEG